jgi:hypothetical protein
VTSRGCRPSSCALRGMKLSAAMPSAINSITCESGTTQADMDSDCAYMKQVHAMPSAMNSFTCIKGRTQAPQTPSSVRVVVEGKEISSRGQRHHEFYHLHNSITWGSTSQHSQ